MAREASLRLQDMLGAIRRALVMTEGRSREAFLSDETMVHACVYQVIVVAEAASWLPLDLCNQVPEIPWSDLVGMGNLLKHAYFRVESDEVWTTVAVDFPVHLAAVQRLSEMEAESQVAAE